ncbi:hypothetical protein MTO96_044260 [Rhipicephalus appendiculatus]
MAQFRFVRLFYFVQALARFATYPSWDVSRTVYLLPTDQQSNQPVHSDSGEVPYHLMTFNDCPQDASLRLTRTAASTKQPVSPQAITRLGASHRFSGHGKITCDTMAQFRFVRLFYFVQALARFATYPSWDVSRTVYLLPTDQQSNQPVHSDSGEVPYHLMTFNDCPQDASLRLTRTAASTKQPVSPQAISQARSFASLQWARENHLRHLGSIPLRATFLLRAGSGPFRHLSELGRVTHRLSAAYGSTVKSAGAQRQR